MRLFLLVISLTIGVSLVVEASEYPTWQELLVRAESLVTAGYLDSANVAVDEALHQALTQHGKADTTLEINLYTDGGVQPVYFRNYAEAESLYARVADLTREILGDRHLEVAVFLENRARVYLRQRRRGDAQPLLQEALSIKEEVLGPEHPDVASTLRSLALLYSDLGSLDEAEPFFKRALAIQEAILSPEHPDVAQALHDLAWLYQRMGRLDEAEPLYGRALDIRLKTLGPQHSQVGHSLNTLGILKYSQGKYDEAEQLFRQGLAVKEAALGSEHPDVAWSLHNLAAALESHCKYAEAEAAIGRAIAIDEKTLGPEHPYLAASLNQLGILYTLQGKYAEAEPIYKRAIDIKEKTLGPRNPEVGSTLFNLAVLYSQLGKYAAAEELYRRALAIQQESLGPEHPVVASTLDGLGILYYQRGQYAESESTHTRALHIKEALYGPEHPDVALTLSNLGNASIELGEPAESEAYITRALRIYETCFGPDDPSVALCLHNLGANYIQLGDYAKADSLLRRALSIREESLGEDHFFVAWTLEALSGVCRLRMIDVEALELADRASEIRRKNLLDNIMILSPTDALEYAHLLRSSVSNYLTCYFNRDLTDIASTYAACDKVLSSKGQVSDVAFQQQRSLWEESDSAALNLLGSLRQTRVQLSNLFVQGSGEDVEEYKTEADSLSNLANQLETDLSRQSAGFRNLRDQQDVSTTRIASVLPKASALVEYLKYDYSEQAEDKIPHYMVLVVTEAAEPVIVELGEADEIDALINQYRNQVLRVSSAGRRPTVVDQRHYTGISRRLLSRIWQPIEEYVAGKDLVLIAPDGALSMVSFAGLIDGQGRYLVERFPVHYLSSGRDMIRLKDKEESGEGLFALGDPDYDASATARLPELAAAEDTIPELSYYATRNVRSGCGDLKDMTVSPLPGTRKEVELIASGWQRLTVEPAAVYFGSDATEDRFKAESAGKRVIHLATHGYFLEGACQPELPARRLDSDVGFVGENPLLLSGLLFAGANLHGEGADSLGTEDGILTAYEVSAMDLEGTELVVLSACETGLGKVEEGEGVYGLRRAFQMAGARTVISALWPVSDDMTAEMMSQLYTRQDESIPETMRRIQMQKINELRQSGQPDHPYTWAGFIATGDWR